MRCVDLLQAREDVAPDRIGVIGHSLGGHNAMFVGAFDTRLKVIVSSCGWTLMDYYDIGEGAAKKYGGRLGPWAQDLYMPLLYDQYNLDAERIPFDFDEVIAALAPRAFFSNSPLNDSNFDEKGVRKGIAAASEVYRFLEAEDNLQVRYPQAEHDFPPEVRLQAYRFIDKILGHTPSHTEDPLVR
jgi:pimeloyl-ACP methyl ester carboxylesterase